MAARFKISQAMKRIGIRVEVPEEMYRGLVELQELRWQESGKKPALSSVIIDLCQGKLTRDGQNVQASDDRVQNSVQSFGKLNRSLPEPLPDKRNRQMDEFYTRLEAAQNERALLLRSQENDLMEAREDFFQKQNDFIQEKEKFTSKSLAGTDQIIELKMLKLEVAQKTETLQALQREIDQNQSSIIKSLKTLEQSAKEPNTGNISMWDKIIPWIPVAVNVVGMYLMYSKLNGKNDLSGLPQQISDVFKDLDPENKQKVTKTIMDAVQGFLKTQNQTKEKYLPKEKKIAETPDK
ncbi:MAG: hypothetical protein WCN92_11270 [Eubacteriales bacterium]